MQFQFTHDVELSNLKQVLQYFGGLFKLSLFESILLLLQHRVCLNRCENLVQMGLSHYLI
jgi:hypothetical protein